MTKTTNDNNQQIYSDEEIKDMKERGLYYSDGSFKDDRQIKKDLALKGEFPVFETPLPMNKDFLGYWSPRFKQRQSEYKESETRRELVEISFPETSIINFIGDTHVGAPETYYERLETEIQTILGTPNSYVILVGDLVDGFFFNPAQMEQIEQTPEQYSYIDSLLKFLSANKRLLVGFGGDHDLWPMKMGSDPYAKFAQDLGAYYMQGVGHIKAKVGEFEYKLTGAHRLPGFSMYNNTHPLMRASKEIQGADVYFSAHTHVKGYSQQAIKDFGGDAHKVHYISIGPYKSDDDYSRKRGWAQLSPQEMFGSAVKIHKDTKQIEYFDDILEANA